MGPLFIMLSR